MYMPVKVKAILENAERPFSIIEEFAALHPKRKILLCDHLFVEGRSVFKSTVKLLWPKAGSQDVLKLEKFLFLLKQAAH